MISGVTRFGLELPTLIGGRVVIETIFAIPGGRFRFRRSWCGMMGLRIFDAVLTLAGNLLRPRVRPDHPKVRISSVQSPRRGRVDNREAVPLSYPVSIRRRRRRNRVALFGRLIVEIAWRHSVFPGLAIFITLLGSTLPREGLRRLLDPVSESSGIPPTQIHAAFLSASYWVRQ